MYLQMNGGPGVARNAGFKAAKSDWLLLLDADDTFHFKHLENLIKMVLANKVDLVASNFAWFDNDTKKSIPVGFKRLPNNEVVSVDLFLEMARPGTSDSDWGLLKPMISKQFLVDTSIQYNEYIRHGEDYLFVVEFLLAGANFRVNQESTYFYTTRESGLSTTTINYDAIIESTDKLLMHPKIKCSKAYTQLILQKSESKKKHQSNTIISRDKTNAINDFNERKFTKIIFSFLSNLFLPKRNY